MNFYHRPQGTKKGDNASPCFAVRATRLHPPFPSLMALSPSVFSARRIGRQIQSIVRSRAAFDSPSMRTNSRIECLR